MNESKIENSQPTLQQHNVVRSPEYYTPELKEFHLGFEFDVYNSRKHYFFESADGWHKAYVHFGVLGDLYNLHRLILDKQIRVKRLDEKDIEQLGGELSHEEEGNPNKMYYFGKHSLIFNYRNFLTILVCQTGDA